MSVISNRDIHHGKKSIAWPVSLKRWLGQSLATLGLLAAPTAALAWQAGGQAARTGSSESTTQADTRPLHQLTDSARPQLNTANSSRAEGDQSTNRVSQHISVTSQQDGSGQNQTSVQVNGQAVKVPASGEVHQTIKTDGGHTTIDISNHKSSSGDSSSSSSINLQVNSSSEASHD